MKFTIDTERKSITLLGEVDMQELYSWMTAGVGIAGWKIESETVKETLPFFPPYNPHDIISPTNPYYHNPTITTTSDLEEEEE